MSPIIDSIVFSACTYIILYVLVMRPRIKLNKNKSPNSKQKVYISGPIKGMPIIQAQYNFWKAKKHLEMICPNMEILNVMVLIPYKSNWSWDDYMRRDIIHLMTCKRIYMLEGWESSKGAAIEHNLAVQLGLEIEYENKKELNTKI